MSPVLEIVGAGPSGLSAALAACGHGQEVVVHEKRSEVGGRFHGDFQGLENWSHHQDVLQQFESCGLRINFSAHPVRKVRFYGPDGDSIDLRDEQPLFYLVRRGPEGDTLDRGLLAQATEQGIEVRFGSRRRHLDRGIVAEGPHRADVIAAGYVFETDMADGCYAAIDDTLAPDGYAYLLIHGGQATVATCLFRDFHKERIYLDRTVEFFESETGLAGDSWRRFGGSGNFGPIPFPQHRHRIDVGEASGYQDALFGFGLRYAVLSGIAAGRTLATGNSARQGRPEDLVKLATAGRVNRWIYAHLTDRQRFAWVGRMARHPRSALHRVYRASWWKNLLGVVVGRHPPATQNVPPGCDCTWCRCPQHTRRIQ